MEESSAAETKRFFEVLARDRAESAKLLLKRSMRGIWSSVVEKYSELAHFVLELLQNADDAGATKARFVLTDKQLIFAHDGTRHFTVSDPAEEEADTESGRLGDVNAITSIANSSKSESSIGKFGVGFKSVFQYTDTPHIYGPEICFKIENFIVPSLLEDNCPERKEKETLFIFPFNKAGMPPKQAVKDITNRLKTLDYPLLFLRNLEEIKFFSSNSSCTYSKSIIRTRKVDETTANLTRLVKFADGKEVQEHVWLMSRTDKDHLTCTVGFFVDSNGLLKPVKRCAYCFFPTKVKTGLNFVVHAPFLLTDSRESIKEEEPHNKEMIKRLAYLAASSLTFLRTIGQETKKPIIGDNLFDVIPYVGDQLDSEEKTICFDQIRRVIQERIKSKKLLPGASDYYSPSSAYIPETKEISNLLTENMVQELINPVKKWRILKSLVFQDLPSNLQDYLKGLGVIIVNEDFLLQHINEDFVKEQDLAWLSKLHSFLSANEHRTNQAKTIPVFLDANGSPCSAFDKEENEILFLTSEGGCKAIHADMLEQPGTLKLVKRLGLKEPSLQARVFNIILPSFSKGRNPREKTAIKAFDDVFRCYLEMRNGPEKQKFIDQVTECSFLACLLEHYHEKKGVCPKQAYFPNEMLKKYFRPMKNVKFVDLEFYQSIVKDHAKLQEFLNDVGVADIPRLCSRKVNPIRNKKWLPCAPGHVERWEENEMDSYRQAFEYVLQTHDKEYSLTLWNTMVAFIKKNSKSDDLLQLFSGVHFFFSYGDRQEIFVPSTIFLMKRHPWLATKSGKLESPQKCRIQSLNSGYDLISKEGTMLARFLGIVEASDREKWANELDQISLRNCGKTLESLLENNQARKSFEEWLRRFKPAEKPKPQFTAIPGKASGGGRLRLNIQRPNAPVEAPEEEEPSHDEDELQPEDNTATTSWKKGSFVPQANKTIESTGRATDSAGKYTVVAHAAPHTSSDTTSKPQVEYSVTKPSVASYNPSGSSVIVKAIPILPSQPSPNNSLLLPCPDGLLLSLRKELTGLFDISPFPKATYIISVLVPKQKAILEEMVVVEKMIDASGNIPANHLCNPKTSQELVTAIREALERINKESANLGFTLDVNAFKSIFDEALTFYSS